MCVCIPLDPRGPRVKKLSSTVNLSMAAQAQEGADAAASSTAAGFHDLAPDFLRHKAHSQLPLPEVWSLGRMLLHVSEAEASSERNVAPLVAAFLLAQVSTLAQALSHPPRETMFPKHSSEGGGGLVALLLAERAAAFDDGAS
jgi:hypothetical protein